ncbi:MAG TPA: YbfB/YjiJ family MFS transporter [Burkholderiaceae bacterium]|nr:YbfB/YjiJ family MFS transporter [Burkholderiaceae bacterium]
MLRGLLIAVLLSFGPTVSNSFARFAYALVLPAMRNDLQLTYSQAGWLNTANAIGYLAGAVLTWTLVRRTGNRMLFSAGMVVTAASLLATGLTHDLALLTAARVLAGIGGALVFISGGALSGNIFPGRPELATMTVLMYFAGAGIGLMLSAVGIPLMLQAGGDAAWPATWQAMGWISAAMTVGSIWAASRIAEPQAASGSASWRLAPFGAQFAAYVCFGVGYIAYMTFVIALMREGGSSTAAVMATWFVFGLATLVAPAVWTRPCARWPGGLPLAAVLAVMAVGAMLPVLSVATWVMLLSAALFGITGFSAPSAISAFIRKALPKPAWGSAIAFFTVAFAASQIAGPVLTGWVADQVGSLRPGLAVSALVLLLGAAIALAQKDRRHEPVPETAARIAGAVARPSPRR